MFVLSSTVTIGQYKFNRAADVTIERSVHQLGASAQITLPTRAVHKGAIVELAKELRPGMEVKIELGYVGVIQEIEFVGYVRKIEEGDTLKIECEDAVYLLRKKNINKSFKKTNLANVVAFLTEPFGIKMQTETAIPNINLSTFYIQNITAADALQRIKEEYGLGIYFTESGAMYVGLIYAQNAGTVKYNLQQNVIASSLKYRDANDVKLRIKAVYIDGSNKKTGVEVGDKDASLRTYHFYDTKSESELRKIANQLLEKEKYSGYEGSITTFLVPFSKVGMRADVTDNRFGRSGTYFVEKVKTSFGAQGARREVSLSIKLG